MKLKLLPFKTFFGLIIVFLVSCQIPSPLSIVQDTSNLPPAQSSSELIEGSCQGHKFKLFAYNAIFKQHPVREEESFIVLREGAPVYSHPKLPKVHSKRRLGDRLVVTHVSKLSARLKVAVSYKHPALGWMDPKDLLCNKDPIVEDNVPLKAYAFKDDIQTPSPSKAYSSPSSSKCHWRCQHLYTNSPYFVYGKHPTNNLVLLSRFKNLHYKNSQLTGWVHQNELLFWRSKTRFQPAPEVMSAHIYATTKEATLKEAPLIALNNKSGNLENPTLLLLDNLPSELANEKIYKVAAPHNDPPAKFLESRKFLLSKLQDIAHLDIFFLIGSFNNLNKVKESVINIASSTFKKILPSAATQRSHLRFGFRLYDSSLKNSAELPSHPLSQFCQEKTALNYYEFIRELKKATYVALPKAEIKSNLAQGLNQALTDIKNCPQHPKLLFVFGDIGDQGVKSFHSAINRFKDSQQLIIPYWVQFLPPAKKQPDFKQKLNYQRALRNYKSQAKYLIHEMIPPELQKSPIHYDTHFMCSGGGSNCLSAHNLQEHIKDIILSYARKDVISHFTEALASGVSLTTLMKQSEPRFDIPPLFWHWIKNLCLTAGSQSQCDKQFDNRWLKAYISSSEVKGSHKEQIRYSFIKIP